MRTSVQPGATRGACQHRLSHRPRVDRGLNALMKQARLIWIKPRSAHGFMILLRVAQDHCGAASDILKYMNLHLPLTSSPPAAGQTVRRRRRFAAWLLAGWVAFWLGTVLASPCDILTPKAQAGQEPTTIQQTIQYPAGNDHRILPCAGFTDAQRAAPVFTIVPFNSTPRVVGGAISTVPLPVVRAVAPGVHIVHGQPSPAPSYHQRTARLLI